MHTASPRRRTDSGLLAIMVASWCSAMATIATATPYDENGQSARIGGMPTVVDDAPRQLRLAELATAAPMSDAGGVKAATDAIACVAGCYGAPLNHSARSRDQAARTSEEAVDRFVHPQRALPAAGVIHSGQWATTVSRNVPASAMVRGKELRGDASGQWLRKIEAQRRGRIRQSN